MEILMLSSGTPIQCSGNPKSQVQVQADMSVPWANKCQKTSSFRDSLLKLPSQEANPSSNKQQKKHKQDGQTTRCTSNKPPERMFRI